MIKEMEKELNILMEKEILKVIIKMEKETEMVLNTLLLKGKDLKENI